MKKFNFKSLLAMVLAIMMVLSLAACGGKVVETEPEETLPLAPETDPFETDPTEETDPVEVGPAETDPKYDPIESDPTVETEAPAETEAPVDPSACKHLYMYTELVLATEQTTGLAADVCAKCGDTINEVVLPVLGHYHICSDEAISWEIKADETGMTLVCLCLTCGNKIDRYSVNGLICDGLDDVYGGQTVVDYATDAEAYWIGAYVNVRDAAKLGNVVTLGSTVLLDAADLGFKAAATMELAVYVDAANGMAYVYVDRTFKKAVGLADEAITSVTFGSAKNTEVDFRTKYIKVVTLGEGDLAVPTFKASTATFTPCANPDTKAVYSGTYITLSCSACGESEVVTGDVIIEKQDIDNGDVFRGERTFDTTPDTISVINTGGYAVRFNYTLDDLATTQEVSVLSTVAKKGSDWVVPIFLRQYPVNGNLVMRIYKDETSPGFVLEAEKTYEFIILVDILNENNMTEHVVYVDGECIGTFEQPNVIPASGTGCHFRIYDQWKNGSATHLTDFEVFYIPEGFVIPDEEGVMPDLPEAPETEPDAPETFPEEEDELVAIDGAFVRGGDYKSKVMSNPSQTNSNIDYLEVRSDGDSDATTINGSEKSYGRNAYLKFNLTKLDGKKLKSAVLTVSFKEHFTNRAYNIYIVGNDWERSTITAATAPEVKEGVYLENVMAAGANSVDIAKLINAAIKAGHTELTIMISGDSTYFNTSGGQSQIAYNANARPNIKFVVADDQSWDDVPDISGEPEEEPEETEPPVNCDDHTKGVIEYSDSVVKYVCDNCGANIWKTNSKAAVEKWTDDNGGNGFSGERTIDVPESAVNAGVEGGYAIALKYKLGSVNNPDGEVSILSMVGTRSGSYYIPVFLRQAVVEGELVMKISKAADAPYFKLEAGVEYNILILVDPANAEGKTEHVVYVNGKKIGQITQDEKIPVDVDAGSVYVRINDGWKNKCNTRIYDLEVLTIGKNFMFPEEPVVVECDNHTEGTLSYADSVVKYVCNSCGTPIWKTNGVALEKWTDDNGGNGFSGERTITVPEAAVNAGVEGGYAIALTYKLGSVTNPDGEVSILSMVGKRGGSWYIPVFLRQAVKDGELVMKISKAADAPYFKLEAGVEYNILIIVDPANAEGKTEHVVYVNGEKVGKITQDEKIPADVDAGSVYVRINDGWKNKCNTRIYNLEVLTIAKNLVID